MTQEYRLCSELEGLTPEIIRAWNDEIVGDVFLVKRQILVRCPKTKELIQESECLRCDHNFGRSSNKWMYCLPDENKSKRK